MANKLIIDFLGTFIDSYTLYHVISAEQGSERLGVKVCQSLPEILASQHHTKVYFLKKLNRFLKDTPLAFSPFQPLVESLRVLKQAGFQLGLLAPGLTKQAKMICEEYEINLFDFIEGETPFFAKDYVFARTLKKYALNPADVLYLSGAIKNLQLAQQNKLKTIVHTWGLESLEELQKAKPTYTILKPGELLTVMTEELVV